MWIKVCSGGEGVGEAELKEAAAAVLEEGTMALGEDDLLAAFQVPSPSLFDSTQSHSPSGRSSIARVRAS